MTLNIPPQTEALLLAKAESAGLSVEAYVEQLIREEEARASIEQGWLESERGEFVDGEEFMAGLLAELDELERRRQSR